MTLSSPRTTAQFFDALKFSFPQPMWLRQTSDVIETEDSRKLISMAGTPQWRFSATVQENVHAVALEYQTIIESVYYPGLAIRAYDFRRPYPKMDPTGSIIGANNVQINSKGVNNSSVSLKGLTTGGYVLSVGDYFEVTSSGNTFLFRIVEGRTANGSGVTTEFEVIPDLPAILAVNDVVNLKKPCARFIITPGSYNPGDADKMFTSGMTLEFEEE